MADILTDDEFINATAPPVPADLGQHPAPDDTGSLNITMTPHPAKEMSDSEFESMGAKGALSNAPGGDTTGDALAKGAATAAIKGAGHIPGVVGDIRNMRDYLGARVYGALTGDFSGASTDKSLAALQAWRDRNPVLNALADPVSLAPSGETFSNPILQQTGEYKPTTGEGRAGMAGLEAGVGMLGPGALAGIAKGGARGLALARQLAANSAKAVPGGVLGGTAGDVTTQTTGDPLAGMVIGAGLPYGVHRAVRPYTPQVQARSKLLNAATDPSAVINSPQGPAGATLGESTLDPGILQLEKAMGNTSPSFQADQAARLAQRSEGREASLNAVAPPADVMAPSKLFRQQLSDIDQRTQETLDQAAQSAQQAHAAIPVAEAPQSLGETMRGLVADADKAKGVAVSKLYDAVDPDGKLAVVTSGARDAAAKLKASIDPNVTLPSPHAQPVIDMVAGLQEVTPFRSLMDLDKTITSKMSEASRAGDRIGHGQLVQLKSAVQNAVNDAIENQHNWEQTQTAKGALNPDQTINARIADTLQRQQSDWYDARANSGAGSGTYGGARSSSIPSGRGAKRQGTGQSGNAPSDTGVPPVEPNFDEGAAERLAAAKTAHGERAQTYRQGPVSSFLDTEGFAGQYSKPAAKVPASVFPKGDVGATNVKAWLKAAQNAPEAIANLQDTAILRLREAMKDGVLTPQALAKWKKDYGSALSAIDDVAPGFSKRFDNAAGATQWLDAASRFREQTLKNAQAGVAAKFLDLKTPGEVGDTLMGIIKSKTGPTEIAGLMDKMDDAGKAGARRAVAQTVSRDMSNADGSISGAKLRNFIVDNSESLEALYGKEGMQRWQKMADEAEQYQKAMGLQRSKTGSDSFANFMRWAKESGGGHLAGATIWLTIAEGLGDALMHGEFKQLAIGGAAAGVRALYTAMKARGIHTINQLMEEGVNNPEVGKAMMKGALDEKGMLRGDQFKDLAKALAIPAMDDKTFQQDARPARASGGKVGGKIDYAAKATQLLNLARKAKKAHADSSKPLLKMPDQLIAGALKLAQQRPE